jgi:hypothetical protein
MIPRLDVSVEHRASEPGLAAASVGDMPPFNQGVFD